MKRGRHALDGRLQLGEHPAIEHAALPRRRTRSKGIEAVQIRIEHEEGVDVPERQEEAAAHLLGNRIAEAQIAGRILAKVDPAHGIGAHRTMLFALHVLAADVGRLFKGDGVAPRLVHLAARLIQQRGKTEASLERRNAGQRRTHHQHGVEPVTELAGKALRNEIGGKPLLPVLAIGAIAERGEGHDTGIQPWRADVFHAGDGPAAVRTAYLHVIDPRPVRSVAREGLPALDRPCLQLVLAADDLELAAVGTIVDGSARPQ